ncbi:MAG: hypothetical protein WCJ64_12650 [Rhodospirillaceae bacterium]
METLVHNNAFAIEVHGRTAGIVVAERRGFMFFAAERTFQALERRVFKRVTHAEKAARRVLADRGAGLC